MGWLRRTGPVRMQALCAALHCIARAPAGLRRKSYKKVAALFAQFL